MTAAEAPPNANQTAPCSAQNGVDARAGNASAVHDGYQELAEASTSAATPPVGQFGGVGGSAPSDHAAGADCAAPDMTQQANAPLVKNGGGETFAAPIANQTAICSAQNGVGARAGSAPAVHDGYQELAETSTSAAAPPVGQVGGVGASSPSDHAAGADCAAPDMTQQMSSLARAEVSSAPLAENGGGETPEAQGMTVFVMGMIFLILFFSSAAGDGDGSYNSTGYRTHGGFWGFFRGGGGRGGGGRGGGCFPAGEMVELATPLGATVPIEKLLPGEIALDGGVVTAVMKLLPTHNDIMYRYDNCVLVTGSHAVLDVGVDCRWRHVEDSTLSLALDWRGKYLYNLITKHHKVVINGTTFSDWEEVEPSTDISSERRLLAQLNSNRVANGSLRDVTDIDEPTTVGEGAFVSGTLVSRRGKGNLPIPIEDIEPGDQIEGGEVIATVKLMVPDSTAFYEYDGRTVASEWTTVLDKDDGIWRHVRDSARAKRAEGSDLFLHQLITTSHRLVVGGNEFADYEVMDDNNRLGDGYQSNLVELNNNVYRDIGKGTCINNAGIPLE